MNARRPPVTDGAAPRGPNLLLPGAGVLAMAAFVLVAIDNPPLYERLVGLWSFHVGDQPFGDLDGPLSWLRCWRLGVDVFAPNACEFDSLPICYSPLLLRLPLPWVDAANTPAYALPMEALYLVSLTVLPRARARLDLVPMLLVLFSPLCVFGVERANLDLLIFAMVALCVICIERGPAVRLIGYALIIAAGLLKFYPWVLMLLLLRERPAMFLALSAVAACIIGSFVVGYRAELLHVLSNMPRPVFAEDTFGAAQFVSGLLIVTHALHAPPGSVDAIDLAVWAAGTVGLYGTAVVAGLRLGRSRVLAHATSRLSPREALCLSVGAALMCGCFFSGVSLGYRSVFLLFAVPGVLALARVTDDARFASLARFTVVAALIVLWSLVVQRQIIPAFGNFWQSSEVAAPAPATPLPGIAFLLLREALWWWLMTFLLAIVVRTVLQSRTWTDLIGKRVGRQPGRARTEHPSGALGRVGLAASRKDGQTT